MSENKQVNLKDEVDEISKRGYQLRTKLLKLNPEDKAVKIANTCFVSATNLLVTLLKKVELLKSITEDEQKTMLSGIWSNLDECNMRLKGVENRIKDMEPDDKFNNIPAENMIEKMDLELILANELAQSQQMGLRSLS